MGGGGGGEKFAEAYSFMSPAFPPSISLVKSKGPGKTQCLPHPKNATWRDLLAEADVCPD